MEEFTAQIHRYLWIVIAVYVHEDRTTTIGIGVTEAAAMRHLAYRLGIR